MKIFLAGNTGGIPIDFIEQKVPFVLQTFWDLKKENPQQIKDLLNSCEEFLLDSGAFTFMNSGKSIDWKDYIDKYVDFINRYDIQYFFNLDLDIILGVEKTRLITDYIEERTQKKSIPVFHKVQGIGYWRDMCKNYDYVAIGASGLTQECKWVNNSQLLKNMIRIAHSYNTKVHGLGYTRMSNINKTTINFDSVDSSSCLSGGRFATVYKFTGNKLIVTHVKGRLKGYKEINTSNIKEWIKMARYKADEY